MQGEAQLLCQLSPPFAESPNLFDGAKAFLPPTYLFRARSGNLTGENKTLLQSLYCRVRRTLESNLASDLGG